jgi:hypothetical protein
MISRRRQEKTVVVTDTQDEQGSMWRAIRLDRKGSLAIVGHDAGSGVEESFGRREYEFVRQLTKRETAQLRRLLGVGRRGDLLASIRERFPETHELESFIKDHGISGTFWNRLGD